jgi:magnesium transporter
MPKPPARRAFRGPPRRVAPGAAPGSLSFDPDAAPSRVRVFGIAPDECAEADLVDLHALAEWRARWPVLWIDIVGLGQGGELQAVADEMGVHVLALEDVVSLGQRAKVEDYGDQMFVVARMASVRDSVTEQLSLFFGDGWVLTIQERDGDCFEGVRARLRETGRRIRNRGSDYLAYALLDSVVDSYFPAIDAIGDDLDVLEEEVLADPDPAIVNRLHRTRRTLVALRKSIVPHRDAFQSLSREPHPLITQETQIFYRDVYDHVLRTSDLIEAYRDLTADMLSTYMTVVSNRMNEVMKVLTIIATIFIPLSFVAGLYGMNFDPDVSRFNMPELGWRYGYPFALLLMAVVGGGFLFYVWRRGWLK